MITTMTSSDESERCTFLIGIRKNNDPFLFSVVINYRKFAIDHRVTMGFSIAESYPVVFASVDDVLSVSLSRIGNIELFVITNDRVRVC